MIDRPETRYARASDGVHIAYQAWGMGRQDILLVPGNITQLDLSWDDPVEADWCQRLGQLGRVIAIDRRGVGLSDRLSPEDLPPAEVLAEDLGVVLDHAGATRPVVLGFAEGGQIAVLFAAANPDRVRGLILYAAWTHIREEDRPGWEHYIEWAPTRWGSREVTLSDTREVYPTRASDPAFLEWVGRVQRAGVSPGAVRPLMEVSLGLDVREVLPAVGVPTLVMHRERDSLMPVELLAAPAEGIRDARLVVLPGEDHWISAEPSEPMMDAIASFLGELEGHPVVSGRRLATMLFTDIVASTDRSAQLGDVAWKRTLEAHHDTVRSVLARHGGREVSTAGDGFFATFEGPAAATRCAVEIVGAVRMLGLEVRAGVHTGEVETIDGEVGGLGVTIGARVGALAGGSEVLVTSTVRDLVAGSGLAFSDAGEHELKGVPDRWRLYRVVV